MSSQEQIQYADNDGALNNHYQAGGYNYNHLLSSLNDEQYEQDVDEQAYEQQQEGFDGEYPEEDGLEQSLKQHEEDLVRSLNLNMVSPARNQHAQRSFQLTIGPNNGGTNGAYSNGSNNLYNHFGASPMSSTNLFGYSESNAKQQVVANKTSVGAKRIYAPNSIQHPPAAHPTYVQRQQIIQAPAAVIQKPQSGIPAGAQIRPTSSQQEAYLQKYAQQSQVQQQAYNFRQQYLNMCEKQSISPSQDLLRALKTHIRNSNNVFSRLSVCHAELDDNHVKIIVTALKNSRVGTLTEILLNHNAISDSGASLLAKSLIAGGDCFSNIVSLELFGNQMGDTCCKDMSVMLQQNKTLKRLKLGDNKIGPVGMTFLSEGLKNNTTLTQLHMGGNAIRAEGLQKLSELCLANNSTLTSLGLRDNDVGAEGMKALAKALIQPTCALSDIQLKGNRILAQGATHLAQALQKNSSLKVLELQSNSIGAAGVQSLCNALQNNRSVHALNFNDNDLGCEGATAVANLLIKNPSITTLGLASNRIRKKGAVALAKSLGGFQKEAALASSYEANFISVAVTGLDLGNNEIGNSGAVALAENLKSNTVLTSLDLRCCEIHLKGILALADMACTNNTLRHLDLGSNYAKNQGAHAFAKVLAVNTSLTRLCLTDNQIYHEGGEALAIGLQSNFTLRNFSYGGQGNLANRIDSQIRRIIDSIVNENKRNWELQQTQQTQQTQQEGTEETSVEKAATTPYTSNNHYRYINIPNTISRMRAQSAVIQPSVSPPPSMNTTTTAPTVIYPASDASAGGVKIQKHAAQQPAAAFYPTNGTKSKVGPMNAQQQQLLPAWFTSHTSATVMDPGKLDHRLEFLFSNKLLKAENPKFPGCFFIGNIMNTLRKVFPDTPRSLDEIELVRFAYHSHKYYVHISREMVKTQIKYLGSANASNGTNNGAAHQQQPVQFQQPAVGNGYNAFNGYQPFNGNGAMAHTVPNAVSNARFSAFPGVPSNGTNAYHHFGVPQNPFTTQQAVQQQRGAQSVWNYIHPFDTSPEDDGSYEITSQFNNLSFK